MKRSKIILLTFLLLSLGGMSIVACTHQDRPTQKEGQPEIRYYTCPMHTHIHADKPGECPICHMTLVPIYKDGDASKSTSSSSGYASFSISPDRQKMIGIKTEAATRKPAFKEIRTVGRVAFDPDLAIAQREFLEIAHSVPSLKAAAISRLKLLGMADEEIKSLEKKGTKPSNLYLPAQGDSVWIYATLYQEEMGLVPRGTKAVISLPSGSEMTFEGTVRSIDPVIDPMTRSARAHIEVSKTSGELKPDTYVNVSLKIDLGTALIIPKSAVIDTGTRKVAFVVQEGQSFLSRDIKTGPQVGEDVIVLSGIMEGDKVVTSATFLVDSESKLKASVNSSATSSSPNCPEGQVWDQGMTMCMPKVGS